MRSLALSSTRRSVVAQGAGGVATSLIAPGLKGKELYQELYAAGRNSKSMPNKLMRTQAV